MGWFFKGPPAAGSFYRNLYALLTFVSLALAVATNRFEALLAVLVFGTLSRTAAKKGWKNPRIMEERGWLIRRDREDPEK